MVMMTAESPRHASRKISGDQFNQPNQCSISEVSLDFLEI
ncbi:hypothetical protein U27_06675 [Candidatus Vecturithrix granuli]|uniref:Uncharacterized protein n=1 Tax=Vecturithrix granuli TaxID=1499967 RepID=A0A081C535_VECG1|nr:hypothetical protein U27_06675 [Candidatus Vecturithrix granuli]